jgi:hypothetical protein
MKSLEFIDMPGSQPALGGSRRIGLARQSAALQAPRSYRIR